MIYTVHQAKCAKNRMRRTIAWCLRRPKYSIRSSNELFHFWRLLPLSLSLLHSLRRFIGSLEVVLFFHAMNGESESKSSTRSRNKYK